MKIPQHWQQIKYLNVWIINKNKFFKLNKIDNDDDRLTSYGSSRTDGTVSGYQTTDRFPGMVNGNSINIPGLINDQSRSIPLTIQNPMYQNYR